MTTTIAVVALVVAGLALLFAFAMADVTRPRRRGLWLAAGFAGPVSLDALTAEQQAAVRELLVAAANDLLAAGIVIVDAAWWCALDREERAAMIGATAAAADRVRIEAAFAAGRMREDYRVAYDGAR